VDFNRESLNAMKITELKLLGREKGVPSPASRTKSELIDLIIAAVQGNLLFAEKNKKGRRPLSPVVHFGDIVSSRESLTAMTIGDLRLLAREKGVRSPTSRLKPELITLILSAEEGHAGFGEISKKGRRPLPSFYNPDDFVNTRESLNAMRIGDLRRLGRDKGVHSPTSKAKSELIELILKQSDLQG